MAYHIRAYVKAALDNYDPDEVGKETAAWVGWAMNKADWFDLTVSRDDAFGKREHEKGLSEKALKKYVRYC